MSGFLKEVLAFKDRFFPSVQIRQDIEQRARWLVRQQQKTEALQQTGAEDLLMEIFREEGISPEIRQSRYPLPHHTRYIIDRHPSNDTSIVIPTNEVWLEAATLQGDRLCVHGRAAYFLSPEQWGDRDNLRRILRDRAVHDPIEWFEFRESAS